ncbi:MAG: dethiobiotin synthase [Thiothrix lacustris]|uniref:ATP-dependent dethiobiotin synthetase BioD n=1 Tax=Thiothrix lacustris TaxID=525917 RepID=A0A1Y1QU53_9GAMM|nr:MAG: dethiobiotin synthase [Thiothrix lacustris]
MATIVPTFTQWLAESGVDTAKGIFMTGTDTGVGKTWIGIQLITRLQALGREVMVRKPVESGWADDIQQTDAWQLANAAGQAFADSVCPYRFAAALAPPRAAQQAGTTLTLQQLVATCPTAWEPQQFLHVEGAGGFYSPLAADGLNADLAQRLGLPVVIVAEDRLGCINHVLLTAAAVQQRGLTLAGVILNARTPHVDGMDNRADIRQYLRVPVLASPFV